jgi:hypothetical protein
MYTHIHILHKGLDIHKTKNSQEKARVNKNKKVTWTDITQEKIATRPGNIKWGWTSLVTRDTQAETTMECHYIPSTCPDNTKCLQ